MTIEYASVAAVRKPWGSTNLMPWSSIPHDHSPIGELWFQRPDTSAPEPTLLLKLLFTKQPLSIQVHPDDAFARSVGLPRGKTEAWYILAATPDAKIAVGLQRSVTIPQLRASIEDGSIADLVQWHHVAKDDVIFVPAGAIHAIGPGLVIAEVQQRSDATFRLFDHGRDRELHIDDAIAVAKRGPAEFGVVPHSLTSARTLLHSNAHFTFERIDLAPNSVWTLQATQETWLLVVNGSAHIDGTARAGSFEITAGEAVYAQSDSTNLQVGSAGLFGLLAYTSASPLPDLLQRPGQSRAGNARQSKEPHMPTFVNPMTTAPAGRSMKAIR